MHKELASHHDIKHDMNLIEHLLRQKGYICVFLPKFHPEINPMRGYGLKVHKRTLQYTLLSLSKKPLGYGVHGYSGRYPEALLQGLYVYLEGLKPGAEVDEAIKKYKIASKSHRRIESNDQLPCPLLLMYNFTSELTTNNFFSQTFSNI